MIKECVIRFSKRIITAWAEMAGREDVIVGIRTSGG